MIKKIIESLFGVKIIPIDRFRSICWDVDFVSSLYKKANKDESHNYQNFKNIDMGEMNRICIAQNTLKSIK